MFKFLKRKLFKTVSDISERIESEPGLIPKVKDRITTRSIDEKLFESIFWDLEIALLENNVAFEVIEKIKSDLKNSLLEQRVRRGKIKQVIQDTLIKSIQELFKVKGFNLVELIKTKKPFVICFFGVNGSGKTTTIAKIAYLLKKLGISCVLAASDTFRAASIEQLQKHAENLKLKLIKHDYGADPAAVAYDAIQHAKAKGIDVVLIDTAGRMHSDINLLDEMKKIVRVAKPDLKIFVGEALTGNDCVEQAKRFATTIGIDAIILTKADVDEKGGTAISISYVTKKPILYLGVGQNYEDLIDFNPKKLIEALFKKF